MVTRKPPAKKAAAKKATTRKTSAPVKKAPARKTAAVKKAVAKTAAAPRKAPVSRGGLRSVTDEEAAAAEAAAVDAENSKPMTVSAAFAKGSLRDQLVALGARIAKSVDNLNTPARDLAALSRRQLEIAREIEAIDAADDEDDITAAASTPDEEFRPEAL